MEQEHTVTLSFSKSETQNIKNISLKAICNRPSYSENIGDYGGISENSHLETNLIFKP